MLSSVKIEPHIGCPLCVFVVGRGHSVGNSSSVPPPHQTLPLSETLKSGSSFPGTAQDHACRVFKLYSLDLPCDFSSSLPHLTSVVGAWESPESALLRFNLVLYFLIQFDLAYCIDRETHYWGYKNTHQPINLVPKPRVVCIWWEGGISENTRIGRIMIYMRQKGSPVQYHWVAGVASNFSVTPGSLC